MSCVEGDVSCVVSFGLCCCKPSHSFPSPGVVARARLAHVEHPSMGCTVCGVAYAVCDGRVKPVWAWFVA